MMLKRSKKKIATALVSALLLTLTIVSMTIAAEDGPSEWAIGQVNAAIEAGIVPVVLQSDYGKATTRAEFCSLAVMMYEKIKGEITARTAFSDTVDIYVQKAAFVGIVSGVGNNRFDPDSALTREQAAIVLANLANALGKPFPYIDPTFTDNDYISSWAFESVGRASAAGVMNGTGNNMFSPKGVYTREQSIATVLRSYYLATGVASYPQPSQQGQQPQVSQQPIKSIEISQSLKRGMTDAEFEKAYNIAKDLVIGFANYTKDEKIVAVYNALAILRHENVWDYSMSDAHYNDIYGFFVLHRTSCAGDVRAAAICMAILGIPSEHVNENQYGHQWLRVELDGDYVVIDINAPYLGYEIEPYKHPLIG